MKEEYKKLFEALKNKTGFSSDPLKAQASKEIIICFLEWETKIEQRLLESSLKEDCMFYDIRKDLQNHIEFIKSL